MSVAECREKECRSLSSYLTDCQERMLKAACKEVVCLLSTRVLGGVQGEVA